MIAVIVRRELHRIVSCPPLVAAVFIHASLLALFVLAWTDGAGIPTLGSRSLYDQLRTLQAATLALLLPWAACRLVSAERADELVRLSLAAAVPPSRLLAGRIAALWCALQLVVLAGVAPAIIVSRMTPRPITAFVIDEIVAAAIALAVAVIAVLAQHAVASRLMMWTAATAATLVLVAVTRTTVPHEVTVAGVTGGALAVAAWLLRSADRSRRYIEQRWS